MSARRRFYPPTESDFGMHLDVEGRGYVDMHRERIRAHEKHDSKGGSMERKRWDDPAWLPVLAEEFGEAASCLTYDQDISNLRTELVQLGAMTAAWIAAIDLP